MSALFLIVRLAGERVAIRAAQVESVVEIGEVIPVPGAAAHVAGLAALRSRVVTVIDCAVSLRAGAPAPVRAAAVVTLDGHAYALLVDGVEDVVEASGEPRPLPGAVGGEWGRIARAAVEVQGDLLLLVDVAPLVAGVEPGSRAA
jgi:purine-binding chemotaxis protein CheW